MLVLFAVPGVAYRKTSCLKLLSLSEVFDLIIFVNVTMHMAGKRRKSYFVVYPFFYLWAIQLKCMFSRLWYSIGPRLWTAHGNGYWRFHDILMKEF